MLTICLTSALLCGCSLFPEKDRSTNISDYTTYFGQTAEHRSSTLISPEIFPVEIPQTAKVERFLYSYYNPWDPCYCCFLSYCCDETDYAKEIQRLEKIGISDYENIYGIEGFPYALVAVTASENGVIYAMCQEDLLRIMYVEISFCNYFSDMNYTKEIGQEYLPLGFDASTNNPTAASFKE